VPIELFISNHSKSYYMRFGNDRKQAGSGIDEAVLAGLTEQMYEDCIADDVGWTVPEREMMRQGEDGKEASFVSL
jgi:hypothetical protein